MPTKFNQENLIDGTFTNKVFPMWSGETSSRSISLEDINETVKSYRSYSALALAGNVNNAISGNQIDAQNAGNDIACLLKLHTLGSHVFVLSAFGLMFAV